MHTHMTTWKHSEEGGGDRLQCILTNIKVSSSLIQQHLHIRTWRRTRLLISVFRFPLLCGVCVCPCECVWPLVLHITCGSNYTQWWISEGRDRRKHNISICLAHLICVGITPFRIWADRVYSFVIHDYNLVSVWTSINWPVIDVYMTSKPVNLYKNPYISETSARHYSIMDKA